MDDSEIAQGKYAGRGKLIVRDGIISNKRESHHKQSNIGLFELAFNSRLVH